MEFPSLGKHCHFCNQMDFLPFKCTDCSYFFCSSHRIGIDHDCPIKPKPKEKIRVKHKKVGYRCTFCKKRELIEIKCMWCNELMCIRHRFPTDHKCTKQNKKLFHKQNRENDVKRIGKRLDKEQKRKEKCSIQ
jgi:predicted nucleic acid binding AN1-type Zn finger protein